MGQERDFRTIGARVDQLLDDLGAVPDVAVREKAEDAVRLLLELYGAGLARVVEALEAAGDEGRQVLERLAGDDLVSGLLILHGLHPVDVHTRVVQALDSVRPYLGSHAGGVELLGIDDGGVVRLRLEGSCDGCPSSSLTVRLAIEQAIEQVAPEVMGVTVEGMVAEAPGPTLLQIQPAPPRGGHWQAVQIPPPAGPGRPATVSVGGVALVVCRLGDGLYAYRDRCPHCASSLAGAGVAGDVLTCGSCGGRYDIRLAGRALDGAAGHAEHLDPVPLLASGGVVRVAVPDLAEGARS